MNNELDKARQAACAALGVIDKYVPQDNRWHYADLVDDPRGRGDGRIKQFADGKGGIVWNHKTGDKQTFFADQQHYKSLTPEEKEQRRRQRKASEEKEKLRQDCAAQRCQKVWKVAEPAECFGQAYLIKKNIPPYGARIGIWQRKYQDDFGKWRQLNIQDSLLLPMFNESGQLRNLQAIFPEECQELGRSKDFMTGGQLKGVFWWVGDKSEDIVCVAEGFATAATIARETLYRCYIAYAANNLLQVGQIIRKNLPGAKIVFCADNDKTPGNPGFTKANEAADAVGGYVAVPPVFGDFNDYQMILEEVANDR